MLSLNDIALLCNLLIIRSADQKKPDVYIILMLYYQMILLPCMSMLKVIWFSKHITSKNLIPIMSSFLLPVLLQGSENLLPKLLTYRTHCYHQGFRNGTGKNQNVVVKQNFRLQPKSERKVKIFVFEILLETH